MAPIFESISHLYHMDTKVKFNCGMAPIKLDNSKELFQLDVVLIEFHL